MTMKETIICLVYPTAYGAFIGLTIGIADTFLNTPFNPLFISDNVVIACKSIAL